MRIIQIHFIHNIRNTSGFTKFAFQTRAQTMLQQPSVILNINTDIDVNYLLTETLVV